jgi:hypothetical protein
MATWLVAWWIYLDSLFSKRILCFHASASFIWLSAFRVKCHASCPVQWYRVAFGRMMSHVEVECTDAPSSISFDNDLPVSQSLFRSAMRTSFTKSSFFCNSQMPGKRLGRVTTGNGNGRVNTGNGNAPRRLGISKSTPLGKRDSIRVCIGSACA